MVPEMANQHMQFSRGSEPYKKREGKERYSMEEIIESDDPEVV